MCTRLHVKGAAEIILDLCTQQVGAPLQAQTPARLELHARPGRVMLVEERLADVRALQALWSLRSTGTLQADRC